MRMPANGKTFFSLKNIVNSLTSGFAGSKPVPVLAAETAETCAAARPQNAAEISLIAQFEHILQTEEIHHLYQPIVSLKNAQILGWEALARGPFNSYFHSPCILFPYAQEMGFLTLLEKLSQKKALNEIGALQSRQKIFINVDAQTARQLESFSDSFGEIMARNELTPKNIVFEITERSSVQDFKTMKKILTSLRNKGYLIAIDDAGAGYSSLQAIAEFQPNYIKLDMSLIHEIDKDPVKEALVETFVTFAQKINCSLIAEGIETKAQLFTVIKLGIEYGQGFLLGRPEYPKKELPIDNRNMIKKYNRRNDTMLNHNTIPISSISQSGLVITPETLVEEVAALFQQDSSLEGVAVTKDLIPQGLVMRQHLLGALSTRYGVSLYYKKAISSVMDANPLMVDEEMSLEKVSQLATARDIRHLYDHIIITKNRAFAGIVSIKNLLEIITQSKIKMAQYANPLTGLPGNIRIQEELQKIINEKQKMMVTYADIDKFKIFNDTYGFERGDQILLLFSKVLRHVCKKYGDETTFLGHIGGDDFLLISNCAVVDRLNVQTLRIFNRLFRSQIFISLASIVVEGQRFSNHLELAEHAARAKHGCKEITGNAYLKEVRDNGGYKFTFILPKDPEFAAPHL